MNTTTATTPPCDCSSADSGSLPGVQWPCATNGDKSRAWIETCGTCKRYPSDLHAAAALVSARGLLIGLATPAGLDDLQPFVNETPEVFVVRPPDPADDLAAFTAQEDAERFAATFDGLGDEDVERVIVCTGATARRMTTERRQSQYDDIGEEPVTEIPSEALGRYLVSCGSVNDGRQVLHITAEEEADALTAAAAEIEDGWIPNEIHDLNTGDVRRLKISTAVQLIDEPRARSGGDRRRRS